MVDLVWIVDRKIKEVIETNVPVPIARFKRTKLKNTTHATGILGIRDNKTKRMLKL